ncbi:hypothetical protein MTO96_034325 [Rhipicephalus appendiculatus]
MPPRCCTPGCPTRSNTGKSLFLYLLSLAVTVAAGTSIFKPRPTSEVAEGQRLHALRTTVPTAGQALKLHPLMAPAARVQCGHEVPIARAETSGNYACSDGKALVGRGDKNQHPWSGTVFHPTPRGLENMVLEEGFKYLCGYAQATEDSAEGEPPEYALALEGQDEGVVSTRELKELTAVDPTLGAVKRYVLRGWPPSKTNVQPDFTPYYERETRENDDWTLTPDSSVYVRDYGQWKKGIPGRVQ